MEDALTAIFFIIFFLFLIGGFVVIFVGLFANTAHSLIYVLLSKNPFRYVDLFPKRLEPHQQRFLHSNFEFYRALPAKSRSVFDNRIAKFIAAKNFETRKGLQLTDEMKLMISFSAIQLTLGLADYRFKFFKTILLYPEAYYSTYSKRYHKGEVNNRGLIVFSWPDFKKGYANAHDKMNLGLHEFAHALFVNFLRNRNDCIHFEFHYDDWRRIGDEEFFRMRKDKKPYLRSYAQTNLMEFFAVCVEYFFEAPREFKRELPTLYTILSKFLAQDPTKLNMSERIAEEVMKAEYR